MLTNREKFLKICQDALDTDPTPGNDVPNEVACSQVISTLIKKLFSDFPIIDYTPDLFTYLKKDKRFKLVLTPSAGCIIVSPSTPNTHGHTGAFLTSDRIASNNSNTGLFQGNYSYQSWVNHYGSKGLNLHIYLFSIMDS